MGRSCMREICEMRDNLKTTVSLVELRVGVGR
jgi:hypothetical protein